MKHKNTMLTITVELTIKVKKIISSNIKKIQWIYLTKDAKFSQKDCHDQDKYTGLVLGSFLAPDVFFPLVRPMSL